MKEKSSWNTELEVEEVYNSKGKLISKKEYHGGKEMKKREYTEIEIQLISVINNFILWNTTEEDRGLAEEYIGEEHVNYNKWFETKKQDVIEYIENNVK